VLAAKAAIFSGRTETQREQLCKTLGRSDQHRTQRIDYEQAALRQGHVAVNSILRDWIKGQVTAIETGILSFEAVFMPYMLTNDGRTVLERITIEGNLLPAPEPQKVVQLPTG
jgi:hypothetical protein